MFNLIIASSPLKTAVSHQRLAPKVKAVPALSSWFSMQKLKADR